MKQRLNKKKNNPGNSVTCFGIVVTCKKNQVCWVTFSYESTFREYQNLSKRRTFLRPILTRGNFDQDNFLLWQSKEERGGFDRCTMTSDSLLCLLINRRFHGVSPLYFNNAYCRLRRKRSSGGKMSDFRGNRSGFKRVVIFGFKRSTNYNSIYTGLL
jgi:hypothetical protein